MKSVKCLFILCVVLLQSCASTGTRYNTDLKIPQLMEWVVDPAADAIFDSVGWVSNENGMTEKSPKTDEEWDQLKNQAAVLIESGNLLMLDGRALDKGDWFKFARALSAAGQKTLDSIIAHDKEELFKNGSMMDTVCENCHLKYAYPQ